MEQFWGFIYATPWVFIGGIFLLLFFGIFVYDIVQRKHAILHNFPIIGHIRYLLESIGPELRQYLVADDREEKPFSRNERRWIYSTSK